jgi:hypothetical protein
MTNRPPRGAAGPQAVRGGPATRCRLTVDLARADAARPAGVSVPSGPYRSLRRLPAEVWLDAAGLARCIAVNYEPAAAADAQVWAIVELWDFGLAVDITPPGPDELLAPVRAPLPGRSHDPALPRVIRRHAHNSVHPTIITDQAGRRRPDPPDLSQIRQEVQGNGPECWPRSSRT